MILSRRFKAFKSAKQVILPILNVTNLAKSTNGCKIAPGALMRRGRESVFAVYFTLAEAGAA